MVHEFGAIIDGLILMSFQFHVLGKELKAIAAKLNVAWSAAVTNSTKGMMITYLLIHYPQVEGLNPY